MATLRQKTQVSSSKSSSLASKGVNKPTSYTASEIAQAAEFLFILDDPASLPLERDIAERWFRLIFLTKTSREFRDKARELYASLRNTREV